MVKFVIADDNDFDWAINKIIEYEIYNHCKKIFFSTAYPQMQYAELAEKMLDIDDLKWLRSDINSTQLKKLKKCIRMQIQLHKIIWDPNERGR
jgi:hypothetical protein